jgi:hypothetical protein
VSGRHAGTAAGRRPTVAVLAAATVVGVWLGVGAPDVSPVAAPAPIAQVQPADDAAVPAPPQTVAGPRGGGRR